MPIQNILTRLIDSWAPCRAPRVAILFGGICIAGLIVTLGACAVSTDRRDDPDSESYVNWVSSNILASWDYGFYRDQATPDLLKQADTKKFAQLHDFVRRAFGDMTKYTEMHGVTRFLSSPRDGVSEIADYSSDVEFTRGPETVYVEAVMLNGHWRLSSFHIHSD